MLVLVVLLNNQNRDQLMKRYEMHPVTSPEQPVGWQLVDAEAPTPGPGQVLIHVRAVSLNYRDLLISQNVKRTRTIVPCSDGAGDIVAVGEGVSRVNIGDRVAGIFFQT